MTPAAQRLPVRACAGGEPPRRGAMRMIESRRVHVRTSGCVGHARCSVHVRGAAAGGRRGALAMDGAMEANLQLRRVTLTALVHCDAGRSALVGWHTQHCSALDWAR